MAWELDDSSESQGGKWVLDEQPSLGQPPAQVIPTPFENAPGPPALSNTQQWAKAALNQLPVLGGIAGGAVGLPLGIPGVAGGAALGAGMGEAGRAAISQYAGLEPIQTAKENIGNIVQQGIIGGGSALVPSGQGWMRPLLGGALTMGGAEAARQGITGDYDLGNVAKSTGIGAGAGLLGEATGRGLDKLFFGEAVPIVQKPLDQFVDWAKKYKLPYSADAVSDKPIAKVMQWSSDYGPGVIITNWQRGKLIDKATQLAKTVNDELGLPPSQGLPNAADDVTLWLQNLRNRNMTHDQYNKAIDSLPGDMLVDVPALHAKVQDFGLEKIAELYPRGMSGKQSAQYNAFKRFTLGDGSITLDDLRFIGDSFWGNRKNSIYDLHKNAGDFQAIKDIGALKGALMDDMGAIQVPGLNQTLKEVRAASDQLLADNESFLRQFPIMEKLIKSSPDKRTGKLLSLFSEGNEPAAIAMRDRILANPGGQDLWEALQSAYLEKVFNSTLTTHPRTGQNVFDPNKFTDWFDKYGSPAKAIMPELAPTFDQWNQIAQGISKDYKRLIDPREAMKYGFGSLIGTGGSLGWLTGSPAGAVVVPGFSTLAALTTMGPGRWGFIRNNLTKPAGAPMSINSRLLSIPPQMEAMEAAQ